MATDPLTGVEAPTLFIVGGADTEVLELNRQAYHRLTCARSPRRRGRWALFEEAHELADVATVAADWFEANPQ